MDEQIEAAVEPVSEVVSEDEAQRAERLSKKRMAYSFPQFFGLLNVGLILTAVALVLFKMRSCSTRRSRPCPSRSTCGS